jgi:hypothetical protein
MRVFHWTAVPPRDISKTIWADLTDDKVEFDQVSAFLMLLNALLEYLNFFLMLFIAL